MAIYEITTPDGQVLEIEGPDGASEDQVIAFAQSHLNKVAPGKYRKPIYGGEFQKDGPKPNVDIDKTLMQGISLGLSDELAGAAGVLYNAVKAPFSSGTDFDPAGAYQEWRDRERGDIAATREAMPWTAAGAEILGGVAAPVGAARAAGSLLGSMGQGLKTGAAMGATAGFGYGEGADSSVVGAGLGGAGGGMFGAALPLAFQMAARPIRAGIDYMSPRSGVGRELVARAMRDDGITPSMAGQRIQDAQGRGTPLGLMDLGDNLRGLTGALSRKPGVSRTLVRDAVLERQAGQNDRVKGAIGRDLGPIVNPAEQSDRLIARGREAAAPLYERAYEAPVVATPELQAILTTPAGRQALGRARTIAANERRDPMALGFALDDEGNVVLNPTLNLAENEAGNLVMSQDPTRQRGYTAQTLDYVKRGLDDIIEAQRDPVTRRLHLDEAGRAINDVRASLVREVDRLNPAYAEARRAYQGPARERDALEMGRKALNASAQDIERMTNGLSESELQQFALGHRAALAETLDRRVDGGDKVGALLGTPRKREALGRVYGNEDDFARFLSTMTDEGAAAETYRVVNTGSPTSQRQLDDAVVDDPSLLEDVAGRAIRGAQNGTPGLIAEGVAALRDVRQFGAGATGQRAREDAAALLSNTDPALLEEALRVSLRDQARRRLSDKRTRRAVGRAGEIGARGVGGMFGYATQPVQ